MDIENTLSTAADTPETGDATTSSDTPETSTPVIVMQSEASTPSTTRSVSLDAPTVDAAGPVSYTHLTLPTT